MGEFVHIVIDEKKFVNSDDMKACANSCPVGIFEMKSGRLHVVEENEDECTFCGLCIEASPNGAIKIEKLYE